MALADDLLAFKQTYLDPLNVVGHPFISDEQDPLGAHEKLTDSEEYKRLKEAAEQFGQNYQQDRDIANQARFHDNLAIARLRAAEEGKTPSAAEALMRTAIDRNNDQALGVAAHVAPQMALRAGLEAQQAGGSKVSAGVGNARAAEINAARDLLANSTGRARAIETSGAVSTGNTLAGAVVAPVKAKGRELAADAAERAELVKTGGTLLASDKRGKTDIKVDPKLADDFLRSLSAVIAKGARR